jgi:ParB family chromosome partitioning protein
MEEFQFSQEAIAEAIGKDRTTVTNLLRLLRLPEEIQKLVADSKLSMGHARAILSLEDHGVQKKMARVIIDKGLSVRQVEELVKKAHQGQNIVEAAQAKRKNRDIEILEEELRKLLGTKVFVEDKKGKGKVVIEYYTLDDLDRILGVLRK